MSCYLKTILQHIFIWTFAIVFWSMMREFGQELVEGPTFSSFGRRAAIYLTVGITFGLLIGSFDYFFGRRRISQTSFGISVVIGASIYAVLIYLMVLIGITIFLIGNEDEITVSQYSDFLLSSEMVLLFAYMFLFGFLVHMTKQIDRKFGPGNLWRMLTGRFYSPREVEGIFMFLDLKASTTIAESIGHIRYSSLVQDFFRDLGVVARYDAEVYQYVGDEAVLTWKLENGLRTANCLNAFFAFKAKLARRSEYYTTRYGLVPEFKAGLNAGKIVMAEVGEIKREIAYHGDTINTAARIQGACNEFGAELLISENLHQMIDWPSNPDLQASQIGDILLKGKTQAVKLYAVEKVDV